MPVFVTFKSLLDVELVTKRTLSLFSRRDWPAGSTLSMVLACAACVAACGGNEPTSGAGTGGNASTAAGGAVSTGSGGAPSGGGGASGGMATSSSAGAGGSFQASGGAPTGGSSQARGGAPAEGGSSQARGGALAAGGSVAGSSASSGAGGGSGAQGCLDFSKPSKVGDAANTALAKGPSGMVASRAHPGVLYAQLDQGSTAVFYAFVAKGTDLGTYALKGAQATDWEDIAVGPGPGGAAHVYLADIGDNAARSGGTARSEIQVLRVKEPDVSLTQAPSTQMLDGAETLRFTYPDAPHDAESLLVDPVSSDLLIVTKEADGSAVVFRAAAATPVDKPTVLERVAKLELGAASEQASAGDASPSGDRFLLRTYTKVLVWPRAATFAATFTAAPHSVGWDTEPQGEGVSFSADGSSWFAMGERASAIYEAKAACP
jgi:hypothetical protein